MQPSNAGQGDDDRDMLDRLITEFRAHLTEKERVAFREMRDTLDDKFPQLSPKQRAWVKSRYEEHVPTYENLFSSGKAPIGKPVPLPAALRAHPLKPVPRPRRV